MVKNSIVGVISAEDKKTCASSINILWTEGLENKNPDLILKQSLSICYKFTKTHYLTKLHLKNYTTYNTFFSFLQKNEDRLVDRNLAEKAVMKMYRGNINIEQICDVISNHFIEKVQGKRNNEAKSN